MSRGVAFARIVLEVDQVSETEPPTPEEDVSVLKEDLAVEILDRTSTPLEDIDGVAVTGRKITVSTVGLLGKALPGVGIILYPHELVVTSDVKGLATFKNLDSGEYTILLSYKGHSSREVVRIENDEQSVTYNVKVKTPSRSKEVLLRVLIATAVGGSVLVLITRIVKRLLVRRIV